MSKLGIIVANYLVLENGACMKIGNKVIITGGTEENWEKDAKPYYLETTTVNAVTEAYRKKEVCTISESEERSDKVKVFNLLNKKGEELVGFYEWELKSLKSKWDFMKYFYAFFLISGIFNLFCGLYFNEYFSTNFGVFSIAISIVGFIREKKRRSLNYELKG